MERIPLVIRVSSEKLHIESISQVLHRSRAWAYKWYKKSDDEGLKGLRDKSISEKPSVISKKEG